MVETVGWDLAGFWLVSAGFGCFRMFPTIKNSRKKIPKTAQDPRQNDKRLHRNLPKRSPVDPNEFFKKVVFDTQDDPPYIMYHHKIIINHVC